MRRTFDVAQVSDLRAEWRAAHPRGAIIVREGEKGLGLYLILKGRAVLFRGREGTDRHQILEVLGAGEMFGMMSALAEVPHDVTARALEAVEIVHVPREYLGDLFRQAPTVALIIAQKLAERLLAASPITTEESEPPDDASFVGDPIDAPGAGPAESAGAPVEAAAPPRPLRTIDPLAIVPTLAGGQQTDGPKKPKVTAKTEAPPEKEKAKLSAYYPQAVQCPICTTKFEATRVRSKALKAISRDSDFHSVYEGVNPVHYAVYVCPNCQYAAFDDSWSSLREDERRRLEEDIDARRRSALEMEFAGERDFDMVMIAYLLALRCYGLREPDVRRRAGLLHRLAWIAREMENVELEQQYVALARSDYLKTFQQDSRITDEAAVTMSYLLGDLSLRLGLVDEAVNWFDKTLRMEQAKKHPGIVRMTRERWSDARSLTRQRSA